MVKKLFCRLILEFFPKQYINLPLGKIIETVGLSQLRIAETEKFPHVTYFFNGGLPIVYEKEDAIHIPSPRVPTYDMKPEMSAFEVTQAILKYLPQNIYDFILVNFANTDMVAHTGNLAAGIQAMEATDAALGRIAAAVTAANGVLVVTGDHGNLEEMKNLKTGEVDTEHSANPVPLWLVGPTVKGRTLRSGGRLADVAPTVLAVLGQPQPADMTGTSLLA